MHGHSWVYYNNYSLPDVQTFATESPAGEPAVSYLSLPYHVLRQPETGRENVCQSNLPRENSVTRRDSVHEYCPVLGLGSNITYVSSGILGSRKLAIPLMPVAPTFPQLPQILISMMTAAIRHMYTCYDR